ncbi:MAG: CinA family protein [Desulfovibrio sp.]|uniref:CinA family protein n=1 Tax=Desulfovibrio sp. 7SRBS1 TaxID=3378064 RepID=UPI003B3ED38E
MKTIQDTVAALGERLLQKKWLLATAESCTGGLIGHCLTNASGSSGWFAGGIISYSNEIKMRLLGVAPETLASQGAVSEETVQAMVSGARTVFTCQAAVAVSGIAGPTGGTPDKPVGTVWMAASVPGAQATELHHFSGDRDAVKMQTAQAALELLLKLCK